MALESFGSFPSVPSCRSWERGWGNELEHHQGAHYMAELPLYRTDVKAWDLEMGWKCPEELARTPAPRKTRITRLSVARHESPSQKYGHHSLFGSESEEKYPVSLQPTETLSELKPWRSPRTGTPQGRDQAIREKQARPASWPRESLNPRCRSNPRGC